MYVDPHDEGEWTVTTYKEDKPEMSHTFNLDVTGLLVFCVVILKFWKILIIKHPGKRKHNTVWAVKLQRMVLHMSAKYLLTSDFMIVEEPLGTSNYSATEGEYASLIYKVSYPYDYCEFTTSDGKVLEPLKCNVQVQF